MTAVYLIHFEPAYKQAQHYLGFAEDLAPRLHAHRCGRGARLTQVAVQAGCALVLARTWPNATRRDERRLKRLKHAPRLCPICRGEVGLQLALLPEVEPFVSQVQFVREDGGIA